MVKRLLLIAVVVFLSVWSAIGIALLFDTSPSTVELDQEIAGVRAEITKVRDEAAKFEGGLIKSVLLLRQEILLSTEAMLLQKRGSFVRRINLQYSVDSAPIKRWTEDDLIPLTKEIDQANLKLDQSRQEANKYSGGLLHTIGLLNVAMNELTISHLTFSKLSAKYGVGLPMSFKIPQTAQQLGAPGNIVNDAKALQ